MWSTSRVRCHLTIIALAGTSLRSFSPVVRVRTQSTAYLLVVESRAATPW
jgi:hypothetical protein